jgi:hypothetical protein
MLEVALAIHFYTKDIYGIPGYVGPWNLTTAITLYQQGEIIPNNFELYYDIECWGEHKEWLGVKRIAPYENVFYLERIDEVLLGENYLLTQFGPQAAIYADTSYYRGEACLYLDTDVGKVVRAAKLDYNASGTQSVQDIFDFIASYFAGEPKADINQSGEASVQDIFDYLALYLE